MSAPMSSTSHLRCSFCGAPLPQPTERLFRVCCPYCDVENRLLSAEAEAAHQLTTALQKASEESVGIEERAAQQRAMLEKKLEEALGAGDSEAALRHFEGMLRMGYASTVHLYRNGMPPEQAEPALQQIDTAIEQSVRSFAEAQGIQRP